MGFGILFLGSLFFCNIPYHNYTDIFAVAIMLYALTTLAPYARGFAMAIKAGLPLLFISFLGFILAILNLIGFLSFPTWLIPSVTSIGYVCKFFFLWLIFLGVDEVAKETDIQKIRAHALRSRFLTPIVCFAGILLEVGVFDTKTVFLKYYLLGFLLFGVIYAILNSKTIFECYMMICFEGDENMDAPPSRFRFGKNADNSTKKGNDKK